MMSSKEEVYNYRNIELEYLLILSIPAIDFDMDILNFDDEMNNVDYRVEILDSSNIENNVYFFAGHSGRGDNCYFNRLNEIGIGDNIYIKIDDSILIYEVVDIYKIVKNGYMEVDENLENVLFLVTCNGYNRQLVVKGVLIN